MHRRDFLKLSGLLSAVLLVDFSRLDQLISRPITVESSGKLYRGTFDGKISVSENAGQTWQLHTCLGEGYSILGMTMDRSERVRAQVGFAGHSFELLLAPNGKNWIT